MFAQTQMESFWSSFFQKTCGVKRGRAPEKTALFFLRSFFFCASCVKRKSDRMTVDVVMTQRTMFALTDFSCHPERSEAESNFFVLDPKRHYVPFAPHCVRSSTALRMTQTKKCRAKRGRIYEQSTHTYSPTKQCGRALCTSRKERSRKVFAELFSKSDREKRRFSFCKAFSFAPLVSKEKAILRS